MKGTKKAVFLVLAAILLAAPAWAIRPNPSPNYWGSDLLLYHLDTATAHPDGNVDHTQWTEEMQGLHAMGNKALLVPGVFGNAIAGRSVTANWSCESPYMSTVSAGADLTIEAWVYWPAGVDINSIAIQCIAERRRLQNCWIFDIENGKLCFQAWPGPTKVYSPTAPFTNNVWYHVAATMEKQPDATYTIKLYVTPRPEICPVVPTPVAVQTGITGLVPASTSTLLLGYELTNSARFFRGYIDEVRWSATALTSFDSLQPGVSPRGASVVWGSTQQFVFDSANTPISWMVTDEPGGPGSVGAVDSTGLFTPAGPGTCKVSAVDSLGNTDAADVTVPEPVVTPDTQTVPTLGTIQFAFCPATPVTWEVIEQSVPGVGSIDASGLFTAAVAGTCKIRATDAQGHTDDSDVITVVEPVLSPAGPAQVVRWSSVAFTYAPTIGEVTWELFNESGGASSVGTIDAVTGVFSATGFGTCNVRATDSVGHVATSGQISVIPQGDGNYGADANTLALYHLDEPAGQTYRDSSGNNIHGNATSPLNTPLSQVVGRYASAVSGFRLAPVGAAFIQTANTTALNSEELTAEAWIYYPLGTDPQASSPEPQGIVCRRGSNTWALLIGGPFGTFGEAGALTFYSWAGDGLASANLHLNTETWYHVAVTIKKLDATPTYEMKLYCTPLGMTTPQLVASKTTTKALKTTNDWLAIGIEAGLAARVFPGVIDEVRISKVARTEQELSWALGALPAASQNIGDAKRGSLDGDYVALTGAISASFADSCYLESLDRSAAIKLDNKQLPTLGAGALASVVGRMSTVGNQRCLSPIHADKLGELVPALAPLGMVGKAAGGGVFGLQPGVTSASGLNTFGLLVRLTGKCVATGTGYFDLDDGSQAGPGGVGIRVYYTGSLDPAGKNLAVTGTLVPVTDASNVAAGLLPTSDIELLN